MSRILGRKLVGRERGQLQHCEHCKHCYHPEILFGWESMRNLASIVVFKRKHCARSIRTARAKEKNKACEEEAAEANVRQLWQSRTRGSNIH
jgi:hypothetical protein